LNNTRVTSAVAVAVGRRDDDAIHQRAQNKTKKILNSGPIGNEGRARRYLRPIKDETLNISFLSFLSFGFDER